MENFFASLKRNIKLAYKSVIFHFKQFLCFYVALFLIQFLFGVVVTSVANVNFMRQQDAENTTYHITLVGLSKQQMQDVMSCKNYGVDYARVKATPRDDVYDCTVTFENEKGDSPQKLYKRFRSEVLEERKAFKDQSIDVVKSPLYTVYEKQVSNIWLCVGILAVLLAVGVVIILLLYNIRINHFKFTYGIYMSYGADFKKLFSTSIWEIIAVSTLTFLPAAAVSVVADWLFFKLSGYEYHWEPFWALLSLPFTVILIYIAVRIPIRHISKRTPLELLLAEDNSNLVSSPRISFNMIQRSFPASYSLFGLIRFRRYNAQVIFSSVIFSVLFICTSFLSNVYLYTLNSAVPEYTVNFNQHLETVEKDVVVKKDVTSVYNNDFAWKVNHPEEYEQNPQRFDKYSDTEKYEMVGVYPEHTVYELSMETVEETVRVGDTYVEDMRDSLMALDGISGINKSCGIDAYRINSYMKLKRGDVKLGADLLRKDDFFYSCYMTYYAADEEIVKYLTDTYKVIGDPWEIVRDQQAETEGKLLQTDDYFKSLDYHPIIVVNSRNNTDKLSLKPGDSVILSKLTGEIKRPTEELSGNHLLEYWIDEGQKADDVYEEMKFVVCAVIEDFPSGSTFPFFINSSDYTLFTGEEPIYKSVSVYVEPDLNSTELKRLTDRVNSWAENYSDTSVTQHFALDNKRLERAECRSPLIISAAATLLCAAPMFWFFSQIMFYGKRDKEMDLLRAIGATEKNMMKMFALDGLIYAGFGVLATALLGSLGLFGVYKLVNSVLPQIGIAMQVRYVFEPPLMAIAIGLGVTAMCGFASSFIPYLADLRRVKRKKSVEFGTDG